MEKEAVLKALRNGPPEGLRAHELAGTLNADQKGQHRLRKLISDLLDDKAIEKAPGARYRLIGAPAPAAAPGKDLPKGWVSGFLRVHPAGYGFLVRDDGEDDAYVGARNRGVALD